MSRYRYEKERAAFLERFLPTGIAPKQLKEEKRICAELFEKYPDMSFWKGLKPPFEVQTLAYFFGPRGRVFLSRAYNIHRFEPTPRAPKPELQDTKVGDDWIPTNSKPRTPKEFLNG